jgi:hypothetical protein
MYQCYWILRLLKLKILLSLDVRQFVLTEDLDAREWRMYKESWEKNAYLWAFKMLDGPENG